ncbi:MAG: beta-lactamase family protein [Verrucomicrobia bacterium]|nr:beta-lactamase family protein [Verrucomicrobiota bacterium]
MVTAIDQSARSPQAGRGAPCAPRAPSRPTGAVFRRARLGLALAIGLLPPAAGAAFKPGALAQLDAAITDAIAEKKTPGAVLWIEHQGQSYHRAYGRRALEPALEPMTGDTVFDVASLTKVLATTPAVLRLVERGQVRIDDPLRRHLPEFEGDGRDAVTVRHLLTHTSGLLTGISGVPFSGYTGAIARALQKNPRVSPGSECRYCDANFILLGELVRRLSGQPLDTFVAAEFYRPLGMRDTGFRPPAELRPRIAPTTRTADGFLRGRVHDPTTRRMGGVSGHAGVFSTAPDLARFARALLDEGELDGARVLRPESVRAMTRVQTPDNLVARRGLGWDIDSGYSRPRGRRFPLGSYGHTGFTGVYLWIDPFSRTFVVFLSNRLHPDGRGNVHELYGRVSTLAAQAVDGFNFDHVPGALPFRTNFIQWDALTNVPGGALRTQGRVPPLPVVPSSRRGASSAAFDAPAEPPPAQR